MGLVNRVVPAAELEGYVKNYAEMISANAPLTIKAVKFIVGEIAEGRKPARPGALRDLVAQCFASRTMSRAARRSWRSESRFHRHVNWRGPKRRETGFRRRLIRA